MNVHVVFTDRFETLKNARSLHDRCTAFSKGF